MTNTSDTLQNLCYQTNLDHLEKTTLADNEHIIQFIVQIIVTTKKSLKF